MKPLLGQNESEALAIAGADRRLELLKESQIFDETRLVASPLFAGRGGPQKNLFEQEDQTHD